MKTSELERIIRESLRRELQGFTPQPIPQPASRPIDDGEHLEAVMSHLRTCKDPWCNVNQHIAGMVEQNYKGCPECGKVVKKEAKVCKHCNEEIEEDDESFF